MMMMMMMIMMMMMMMMMMIMMLLLMMMMMMMLLIIMIMMMMMMLLLLMMMMKYFEGDLNVYDKLTLHCLRTWSGCTALPALGVYILTLSQYLLIQLSNSITMCLP